MCLCVCVHVCMSGAISSCPVPSSSGVGVHSHLTGATCLTNFEETPMSQVGPSLGPEVRGRGDTKYYSGFSPQTATALGGHQHINLPASGILGQR